MKKLVALSALAVLATPTAFAESSEFKMPTIYGKLNKAYPYVTQEKKYGRKSSPGLVDVGNSETRLGAKGAYDLDTWKAKYTLEIGLNSTSNSASNPGVSGRIRIRLAKADFVTKFGTFTVGQDYTATAKAVLKTDAFAGTVASGIGSDYASWVANANSGVGFLYRSRKDLVKYATPVFAGVQYKVSADKGDKASNDPSSANDYGPTYYEHLLSWDKKMGENKLRLQFGYTTWAQAATGDNSNLHFGGNFSVKGFTFLAGWSKEENKGVGSVSTATDETTRMTVGMKYKHGMHTAMLGYYDFEDKAKRAAATTKEEDTQISVGYKYSANKYVSLNAIYTNLNHKETTAANKNDANIFSLGTEIKF